MLGNNEQIPGLDLDKMFSLMISELPWASLKNAIQSNSHLMKRCMVGGHRFEPKRRKRFEKVVCKVAIKEDYSQTFCNSVFAHWYPVHEELHKVLEDYFHSDEYKEYRKENELTDEDYVLSDEKFEEFFNVEELNAWRILLCFSPLKFTQEQADKIIGNTEQSADLLEKVQKLEAEAEEGRKAAELAERERERLQERADQLANENQELKKARRDLSAETKGLENKFTVSQNENKKLRDQLDSHQEKVEQKAAETVNENEVQLKRSLTDLERARKEMEQWRERYEAERIETRRLNEAIESLERKLADAGKAVEESQEKIESITSFATLVLQQIDWPKVGGQMKMTPTIKRQFNSLVKRLNYEEEAGLTIDGTLTDFWDKLQFSENELLSSIAESNIREVANGDVEGFWSSLTDKFNDVVISLEARLVLIKMLQEIFYQVLDMEDLEKAKIPVGKKR